MKSEAIYIYIGCSYHGYSILTGHKAGLTLFFSSSLSIIFLNLSFLRALSSVSTSACIRRYFFNSADLKKAITRLIKSLDKNKNVYIYKPYTLQFIFKYISLLLKYICLWWWWWWWNSIYMALLRQLDSKSACEEVSFDK